MTDASTHLRSDASAEPQAPQSWHEWCSGILEPAVLHTYDMKDPAEAIMANQIRQVAASAFRAGHRYGFARGQGQID